MALLIFRQQLRKTTRSIRAWLKRKFKWLAVGCSVIIILAIYLLLILVTDVPSLPIVKAAKYVVSKISAIFQSSAELSPTESVPIKMTDKPKYNGERNKLIFLSVLTVLFLKYLLITYKRKVFEEIPFGEILIEMYDEDIENSPKKLIPTLK